MMDGSSFGLGNMLGHHQSQGAFNIIRNGGNNGSLGISNQ
jgi:hypothetical protein